MCAGSRPLPRPDFTGSPQRTKIGGTAEHSTRPIDLLHEISRSIIRG